MDVVDVASSTTATAAETLASEIAIEEIQIDDDIDSLLEVAQISFVERIGTTMPTVPDEVAD